MHGLLQPTFNSVIISLVLMFISSVTIIVGFVMLMSIENNPRFTHHVYTAAVVSVHHMDFTLLVYKR